MKKDILQFVENLSNRYKQKRAWKNIVGILSCLVIVGTMYLLISPASALGEENSYTLTLKDSYEHDWKTGKDTIFNLDLYFMDTTGNYIEGEDVTIEIGPNAFADDPYGFGYVPINGETTRGKDIIKELGLTKYTDSNGAQYEFDHAEVKIGETWYNFTEDSNHWDVWCQYSNSATDKGDYGWRGKYGDSNTAYTVTEETKYKFVYKKVAYSANENSVPSLDSSSGITFKMFNYAGDNSQTGTNNINNNGVYNYFTFRGVEGASGTASKINQSIDADGFKEDTRIKVLSNLQNGYPVFDCREASGCTDFSLGYLFGASTNPVGGTVNGVTSYNAQNTLLQKIGDDYYYSSNDNAVDFDTENNKFILRNYTERSQGMTTYVKEVDRYEFMPFNYWNDFKLAGTTTVKDPDTNVTTVRPYNYTEADIDHWFGMTMEFTFYMSKDGEINGNPMIFEFSGDDDVWVFIDDVLVLDLGGTHGAVDGSINFSTGAVESYLNWNGTVGKSANKTATSTTIYEMFQKASKAETSAWNEDNTTFKDYSQHTLKFFYLERGASVSNCKIKFNMPVLPSGSLSVQKEYQGTDNYPNEEHEFTLYDNTSSPAIPVSNKAFTIGETTKYTDENGKFTLKTGEVALFYLTNYNTYYVEETKPGAHSVTHSCNLNGTSCANINKTDDFTIGPDSAYLATFTNKIKTYDLKVSKIAYDSSEDEQFQFQVTLRDKTGAVVSIPNDTNAPQKYTVNNVDGTISFSLKNEEFVLIKDIPVDTNVTLEETMHDGYNTVIKSGEIVLANDDTYSFAMDTSKDITVYNIPGAVLPETGGSGIGMYLIVGFGLMIASLVGYFRYLPYLRKEGE